jgi:hypothetical protein
MGLDAQRYLPRSSVSRWRAFDFDFALNLETLILRNVALETLPSDFLHRGAEFSNLTKCIVVVTNKSG